LNCQKKQLLVLAVGSSGSSSGGSSSGVNYDDANYTENDNSASIIKRLKPIQGATTNGQQVWKDSETGKKYLLEGNGNDLKVVEL
jgi:hypothetical protein